MAVAIVALVFIMFVGMIVAAVVLAFVGITVIWAYFTRLKNRYQLTSLLIKKIVLIFFIKLNSKLKFIKIESF